MARQYEKYPQHTVVVYPPEEAVEQYQKSLIGDYLYHILLPSYPVLCGKITGMLLEAELTLLQKVAQDPVALTQLVC